MPELDRMNPWVLVRKGKPQIRKPNLDAAKKIYNAFIFNGVWQPPAAVYGPEGEAWYRGNRRGDLWYRDDARRARAEAARRQAIEDERDRATTLEGPEQC